MSILTFYLRSWLSLGWMLSVWTVYNFWWILNLTVSVSGSHLSNNLWSLFTMMSHEYLSGTVSNVCLRSVSTNFGENALCHRLRSAPGLNPTVYFTDVCF